MSGEALKCVLERGKILERVSEHAEYIEKQLPDYPRIFTALQGSQNYGLADAESDVDTKTLVLPVFEELVFAKKRMSTTLEVAPTIEHADVKDVREMFTCFRKQNINFLEILFTPYVDVNPTFEEHYLSLHEAREEIAHLNPYQALRSMIGCLMEKYHAFDHPYPSIAWKIEKYRYDPKQLHHMLRFKEFLIRFFVDGDPYEDCLLPKHPSNLLAVKRGSLSYESACELREETKLWADEFLAEWKMKLPNEENKATSRFMDELVMDMFMKAYQVGGR